MMLVLIWQRRADPWLQFMYQPVVSTLVAGFQMAPPGNREVLVRCGAGWVPALGRAAQRLEHGDVFILVGSNGMWQPGPVPWALLQRTGVRRVLYQTEPTHRCLACQGKACYDELWDFSLHNLDACSGGAGGNVTLRHVPPGAVPSIHPSASGTSRPGQGPGPLLFVGSVSFPQRRRCMSALRKNLSALATRDAMRLVERAFDDDTFHRKVLGSAGVFLNLHKACGDAHNPVEGFRVAKLLNAGRLVISERAHPLDERAYDGTVLFCDSMAAVADLYAKLAANGSWLALAAKGAANFRTQFAPRRIFERARIYAELVR
jgi:hypothetical protein